MARPPKVDKRKKQQRLTLAMSTETKAKLIEVQKRLGAPSMASTVSKSLALLDVILDLNETGGEFYHCDGDGKITIITILHGII